jgi:hypothetical protein
MPIVPKPRLKETCIPSSREAYSFDIIFGLHPTNAVDSPTVGQRRPPVRWTGGLQAQRIRHSSCSVWMSPTTWLHSLRTQKTMTTTTNDIKVRVLHSHGLSPTCTYSSKSDILIMKRADITKFYPGKLTVQTCTLPPQDVQTVANFVNRSFHFK